MVANRRNEQLVDCLWVRKELIMNLFKSVKESVDAREAAEVYGLEVNNSGMAICPFHDDNNPSMKVDERYHCFACQADGDVIDFVANYFELSKIDAAKKIAKDFGIEYQSVGYKKQKSVKQVNRPKPIRKDISVDNEFSKRIRLYNNILCEYRDLLESYKIVFAPNCGDEELHPMFVKVIKKIDFVEYLISLANGTTEEKIRLLMQYESEVNKYDKISSTVRRKIS